jgi:23S rRNA (uracil1939-C5)-methyltransferase
LASDDTFELALTGMAHGGSALGRHDGRTIFVPYTIPGERVLAHVVQAKGRVAFAEGLTLVEASSDRVFPRCPHFGPGKCGRCHWQHIDYAAQLLLKQDVLADQLERIGGFTDVEVRPVIPSPQEWAYNHHMTLLADGAGRLGFPSSSNDAVFPITECHILQPDLLALYGSLQLEGITGIEKLALQIGTDGAPMLILTMANDEAPELVADLPASVNLLVGGTEPVNLIGDLCTYYTIAERRFRVTAGSFFRPNISQLENLAALVLDALNVSDGESVLDLYGGVGFFSAFIAPRAALVTLADSYSPALNDADENLSDLDNVDIIEGTVEDVLSELDDHYDAAVIDPPPDGLSRDALDRLAALEIPRLVYVSGDPATLARDGNRLAAHGYRLSYVQPIDLAPQTYYIDSAALFVKG